MNFPTCSRSENKRFAAVAFSDLRIEIARTRAPSRGPLAVVLAHSGGSITGESSLLGNTRIDEVSSEALALGIEPGFTIAAARARSAELAVRVVSASAVEQTLARAAEAALAFGRSTAFSVEDDMVFVDVTGCEHLHACPGDPSGARTLATRLQECIAALGHGSSRVAVARGPQMAAAFARCARASSESAPLVDTDDEAFTRLPIAALGLDAANADWLTKMGLSTIADLQRLPASELGPRLGNRTVMALLRGEDENPITPYDPPEEPEERVELEYGIESHESLLFVAKTLCDRLSARLAGRTQCAIRLELVLALDRALLPDTESPRVSLPLRLSAPIRTSAELMAVLRGRIESYVLPAPVLAVTLRATKLAPYEFRARDLFIPETRAEIRLPQLVAELAAEIGEHNVGMLTVENRWIPSQRARLTPFSVASAPVAKSKEKRGRKVVRGGEARLVTRAIEPVRFLHRPMPYTGPGPAYFLARNGAAEWWRGESMPAYDELAVFVLELGTMVWIVRECQTKQMAIRGYIAHV